ncbi:PH domain-containing protein [bacterium]|nr:PH domain-containing protein [bacterium]
MMNTAPPLDIDLAPGETILWTGQPKQGFHLEPKAIFGVVSALLMAGICLSVISPMGIPMRQGEIVFVFFGTFFGGMLLYLLGGRFLIDIDRRRRDRYVITSERIYTGHGSFSTPKIDRYDLAQLNHLQLIDEKNGWGTIFLQDESDWTRGSNLHFWYSGPFVPALELVPEPRRVFEIIRQAKSGPLINTNAIETFGCLMDAAVASDVDVIAGEKVLWTGRPKQGWHADAINFFGMIFGSLILGMTLFVLYGFLMKEKNGPPYLFLIPWSLLMGGMATYLLAGRFVVDLYRRRATTYAITNLRIVINQGIIWPRRLSFDLATVEKLSCIDAISGRGSIIIGVSRDAEMLQNLLFMAGGTLYGQAFPTLELIERPKEVFQLLQRIRDAIQRTQTESSGAGTPA